MGYVNLDYDGVTIFTTTLGHSTEFPSPQKHGQQLSEEKELTPGFVGNPEFEI